MRTLAAALLLAVVTGCAGGSAPDETAPAVGSAGVGGSVLAFVFDRGGRLAELDARTLAPRRQAIVGFPAGAWARSPDGGRLVLGSGSGAVLSVVDLRRMRAARPVVKLGGRGHVEQVTWLAPRRVAALVRHARSRLVVADLRAGRAVVDHPIPGVVVDGAAGRAVVVALVAPRSQIGPATLLALGQDGRVRSARLGLEAGWDLSRSRQLLPGVAVDSAGRRAVVVAPGGRVAEVDLRTLQVAHHTLSRRVSLLGRLRNWLEPPAHAKGYPGSVRWARWVGERWIAVTGFHQEDDAGRPRSTGVELIDTRDWSVRTLDEDASLVAVDGSTVLVYGGPHPHGAGLKVFEPKSGERVHLLGDRYVGEAHVVGRYAYLPDGSAMRWEVVDLAAGRVAGRAETSGTARLVGAGP